MKRGPLDGLEQAAEPEQLDVVPRPAVDGKVGEDLTDDRAKLEAMPGEARADDDRRRLGMAVDQEMLVRRRLEKARVFRASVGPAPSGK